MGVALAIFSGFFPVGDLHAQGNATFSVSSVTAAAGDIAPVTVSVIHDAPATAYSFTLVCDPASASLGNVQLSAEVLAAQGSAPFVVISEFTTLPGFQCSVIFDIIALPTLSANVTHDICHADLTVAAGAAPGVSALDLTSDVTEPPLQPVQILASGVGGAEMLSVGVDGTLEVIAAETATLAVVTPVAPVAVGDAVDARIEISGSATIDACSFGVAHDPAFLDLPLGGVAVGADLAAARGGLGPEFLAIEILPAGFTFAMAVQASGVGAGLAAGGPQEIAVASYAVLPTAPYGSTALVPTTSQAFSTSRR